MKSRLIKFLSIAIFMLVVCSTVVPAQSAPPRLFYSDLESGPNTGAFGVVVVGVLPTISS